MFLILNLNLVINITLIRYYPVHYWLAKSTWLIKRVDVGDAQFVTHIGLVDVGFWGRAYPDLDSWPPVTTSFGNRPSPTLHTKHSHTHRILGVCSRADCRARLRQPACGPEDRATVVGLLTCGRFQPVAAFSFNDNVIRLALLAATAPNS